MLREDALISDKEKSYTEITTANNEMLTAESCGGASLTFGDDSQPIDLNDVLYVPTISESLLSISKLCDAGYYVLFTNKRCKVFKNRKLVGKGYLWGDIDKINMSGTMKESARMANRPHDSEKILLIDIWHKRFCHVNKTTLTDMAKTEVVDGFDLSKNMKIDTVQCTPCAMGKMHNNTM